MTPGADAASPASACTPPGLTQQPDGRLSGCIQIVAGVHGIPVDSFPPGDYTLSLHADASRLASLPFAGASIIRIDPPSGRPATTVTIEGVVPGGRPRGASDSVTVCWAGCAEGIEGYQKIDWLDGERFLTRLEVPETAWVTPNGPRPLRPGPYPIEVCLVREGGECRGVTGSFEVEGASARCVDNAPCTELSLTPAKARPGDVVRIDGWAPLVTLPHGTYPRYWVDISPTRPSDGGTRPGRPVRDARGHYLVFAPTLLTVAPAMRWADLAPSEPVLTQPGGGTPELTPDPADPRVMAYCTPHGVRFTTDGGHTWREASTAHLREAAAGGHRVVSWPPDRDRVHCRAVAAERDHPGTVFVSAEVSDRGDPYESTGLLGFVSSDEGTTWSLVPAPAALPGASFGGFKVYGSTVQALFGGPGPDSPSEPVVVQETSDGGRTWSPGAERCPARGPCVGWGPDVLVRCAGGAEAFQPIRHSLDGGRTFATPEWLEGLRPCGLHSLVGLADGHVLLLVETTPHAGVALRRSGDGGRTWERVALPALPEAPPWAEFSGLTMLSDGRLLAFLEETGQAFLLAPRAESWCPITAGIVPTGLTYRTIGDQLWWLGSTTGHVAQAALRCTM